MVNATRLKDHTIVADKYLTKLSTSFVGVAGSTSLATSAILIYGNSCFQPFNTSVPITTNWTATNSSLSTAIPIGFTALSTLYGYYRVRSSRIRVSVVPTDPDDTGALIVAPSGTNPSSTIPRQMMNIRYSKWQPCAQNNNVKENTIVNYISSAKALGLSEAQYEALAPTAVSSAPPSTADWYWVVVFDILDGTTNDNTLGIFVELDMYVEFSEPQVLAN